MHLWKICKYLFCYAALSILGVAHAFGVDEDMKPGVDLSSWSFEKQGSYQLQEGWTVYRDKIVDPIIFTHASCQSVGGLVGEAQTINAPDVWGPSFTASLSTGHGLATYCLEIALPNDGHFHSIRMGTLRSVAAIYAVYREADDKHNAVLLYKNGDPHLHEYQVVNNPAMPLIDLPYGIRNFALVVQVNNNIHKQGGMIEVPEIGLQWYLDAQINKSAALPGALAMVLLFMSLGSFAVGLRYQKATGHNLFALLTLTASCRVIFVSDIVWDYFPMFPLSRKYDLEYMSLFLIGASYYAFITYLFRERIPKLDGLIYGSCALVVLYTLLLAPFFPPGSITLIREAMQLLWLFIGVGVMYAVVKSSRDNPDKYQEAFLIIGTAFMMIIYELSSVLGLIDLSLEWSQFIIVIVMLIHARAFVINTRRVEQERDELTRQLQKTNEDLKNRAVALDLALVRAEESSKAKSEFLATVSHELRTPLNAIVGFSELMKRQLFGPIGDKKYVDYVSDIQESGMHLLSLVNDILDLTRVESDADPLDEKQIEIRHVIEAVLKLLRGQAEKRDIICASSAPHSLPYLLADERKLKQVLINLVNNAIKFNKDGGSVTVKARVNETGYYIDVIDTGIGIEKTNIPIVLRRFGQVESQLNRKYEGVGIGMPLSQALLQQHGGELTISSVPGKGTTVTIHFPPERCIEKPKMAVVGR